MHQGLRIHFRMHRKSFSLFVIICFYMMFFIYIFCIVRTIFFAYFVALPVLNLKIEKIWIRKKRRKKTEQKDELMENDRRYPVEQVSNTGEPTKKEVKAAVKRIESGPEQSGQ